MRGSHHPEGGVAAAGPPHRAGDRYHAIDGDALRWVRATLLHSSVVAMRSVEWRPDAAELDALYDESLLFAALFGLRKQDVSPDWESFDRYVQQTSAQICVTRAARHLGQVLLRPPALRPALAAYWYRVWTTGLLPAPLREGFALTFGHTEQALFRRTQQLLPRLHGALPSPLRRVPGYADALWRLRGRRGRDPVFAFVEKVVLRLVLGAEG